jgi:hypothetical protein
VHKASRLEGWRVGWVCGFGWLVRVKTFGFDIYIYIYIWGFYFEHVTQNSPDKTQPISSKNLSTSCPGVAYARKLMGEQQNF